MPKVVTETLLFDQGDMETSPIPAPSVSSARDNAEATTAPAMTAAHDTPEADAAPRLEHAQLISRREHFHWSDLAALLRKPSLWLVSISYFFLELCRYALMFWLPLYMVDRLKYSLQLSGYVSSLYELVGIVGALLAGYISDRFMQSRRAPVSAIMLYGLGVILLCQSFLSHYGIAGTVIVISMAGLLSYGPDTLLSGAGAQDIGEVKAAASATGLIEGIGHMGALLSPYLVVYVSGHYGWDHLFLIFAGAAFLAGAVLMPMWDLKPALQSEIAINDEAMQQAR